MPQLREHYLYLTLGVLWAANAAANGADWLFFSHPHPLIVIVSTVCCVISFRDADQAWPRKP